MGPELVDLRDLANLEKSARAFVQALEAAEPAFDRLQAAKYPGIAYVLAWGETKESLETLIEGLEDLRVADGDQAAADYLFHVKRCKQSVKEAAVDLIENDDIARVEPMRRYAATVA